MKKTERLEKTGQNKPMRNEKGQLLPGQTANPNGRPKGSVSIIDKLRQKLQEVPPGQKKEYAQLLVDKWMDDALVRGDFIALKEIVRYIDGMPVETKIVDMDAKVNLSIEDKFKQARENLNNTEK